MNLRRTKTTLTCLARISVYTETKHIGKKRLPQAFYQKYAFLCFSPHRHRAPDIDGVRQAFRQRSLAVTDALAYFYRSEYLTVFLDIE